MEVRVARLVQRGLAEDDARARIAAQATDEQRRAVADVVLDNSGTPEHLAEQVDRFWADHVESPGPVSSRRATEARARAEQARRELFLYVFLAGLLVTSAVARWLDDDSPVALAWVFTVVAAAAVVSSPSRGIGGELQGEPVDGVGVELVDVDETVLSRLVGAALSGADPDEVTPPMAGPGWGPERIEWLRRLHRDRRLGLDGPLGEATWAVAVDGEVVGGVRLKRTAGPGRARDRNLADRGSPRQGVGRKAIADVLEQARAHGARAVRADTSPGERVGRLRPAAARLPRPRSRGAGWSPSRRWRSSPAAAARRGRPGW